MARYSIKQNFKLGGESFTVKDDSGQVVYLVKGSFMTIPKTFTLLNADGQVVSRLKKPVLSLLPRFEVVLSSGQGFALQKKLSVLRDRYELEGLELLVDGNIWDTSFALRDTSGREVARISKKLLHLTSTYEVDISLSDYDDLVISLVVAIDYVEMLEASR